MRPRSLRERGAAFFSFRVQLSIEISAIASPRKKKGHLIWDRVPRKQDLATLSSLGKPNCKFYDQVESDRQGETTVHDPFYRRHRAHLSFQRVELES